MILSVLNRVRQGHRTNHYPDEVPPLPERLRGRPAIEGSKCESGCSKCAEACPTQAIAVDGGVKIDLGKCLFCTLCTEACPTGAITMTPEFRLATRSRESLVTSEATEYALAKRLDEELLRVLGRSLKLRVVSAGGCNGCEVEVNVLSTIVWDLGRFGIQYVASPRHADGLLITGPVTRNMELALRKTWDAVPGPKVAIAVGACAISGGPYATSPEQLGGAASTVPIDLYIPGCPPHPLTILDGLLRMVGRIEEQQAAGGRGKT